MLVKNERRTKKHTIMTCLGHFHHPARVVLFVIVSPFVVFVHSLSLSLAVINK